jgi:hypothetical protein
MSNAQNLTATEKASACAIYAALRPALNPDAFRAACRASREQHGDRHDIVKTAATHYRLEQLA